MPSIEVLQPVSAPIINALKQAALTGATVDLDELALAARNSFLAELQEVGDYRALWHNEMRAFDGKPNSACVPHKWEYAIARDIVLRSACATTPAEAERRALLMLNPGVRRAPYTSDTILGAWQLLLPGERALCHRHTVFALRFFIEGAGAYTAVGGDKMYMEPGDLVLTTQFAWHDHGNEGTTPAIWLDGLDQPLFEGNFPINFQTRLMQHPDGEGKRYHDSTVKSGAEAPRQYKWADMKKRLDAAPGASIRLEYLNPSMVDQHVSRTIAAYALRVDANSRAKTRHDTCNNIFHCVAGDGIVFITDREGNTSEMPFRKNDTWVIPAWHAFTVCGGNEKAYLFTYTDFATLEKLGFYATGETHEEY
ncbi:cupin domain-containing protein [Rhodotorula paludigena]|uniref:cupin domain-containing protein n=1 Tax=Rhodotorula paludigena TaxID=86838 RepID=UPI00317E041E